MATPRSYRLLFASLFLCVSLADAYISAADREYLARIDRYTKDGGKGTRPPGRLLLNMLIKNEEEHLRRSLPEWAKIIDYWIIGVDDANTDDSESVIRQHLGHIPGEIVTVHFDGMGPTWTQLVEIGIRKYPAATHGIIADADFKPITNLDKRDLDVRCSKVVNTDRSQRRNMDWIYRNLPGARVKRRTHQSVEGPVIPGQEVTQTLLPLVVEEMPGGWQDRTPGKHQRYINWLMKDLQEMPNDTRTIYYLGHGFFDAAMAMPREQYGSDDWRQTLQKALHYFTWRSNLRTGYFEERWQAFIKVGEINERFFQDYEAAKVAYQQAIDLDPERADAWFYMAQLHRLHLSPVPALPFIRKAVQVPFPVRSIYQWQHMYDCLVHQEYVFIATAAKSEVSPSEWRQVKVSATKALDACSGKEAIQRSMKIVDEELKLAKKARSNNIRSSSKAVEGNADESIVEGKDLRRKLRNLMKSLHAAISRAIVDIETDARIESEFYSIVEPMETFIKNKPRTCARFNDAVKPYLQLFNENISEFQDGLEDAAFVELLKLNSQVAAVCRE